MDHTEANPRPRRRSRILRIFGITALSIIVAAGIIVLLIWVIVKPRELVYTVEEGSVQGFDLRNHSLSAKFNFTIRAYNPNAKMSMHYGPMEVIVWSDDQPIAFDNLPPYYHRRRTSERLEVHAEAQSTQLMTEVADDLLKQKRSGHIELDVQVKASLKFKVGMWKSASYEMNVWCTPVVVYLNTSTAAFQRTYCDYDI